MKKDWAEQKHYVWPSLLIHKTDIINSAFGFASAPVSLKKILCARELPCWIEIMNIQSIH